MKLILFGTGASGRALYPELSQRGEVVAFADNNASRWGTTLFDVPICKPEDCLLHMEYDAVVITSFGGFEEILSQCRAMGIPEWKIDKSCFGPQLESRKAFLRDMAGLLNGYEQAGAVAEAGVYGGDFAKYINEYFPERTLHLFDTFEGFDQRDVAVEAENAFSEAKAKHLARTSVELVMSKMKYPDRVRIHKGYFPDTAVGIQDRFCFVNLDMDLYLPTCNGLRFFADKMTERGVILVHDYYTKEYAGVKAAVDEFISQYMDGRGVAKYPIGDSVSILLAGPWR